MSSWGMDDGSTLTGDGDFTGSPAANTFTSNNPSTVWDNELEAGDCIIGADGLLYRITAVTSNTAATLDRNYEGANATDQSVTKIELPRHIKITNDDGTGKTLQDLGIFGITKGEADAGVDNLAAIGTVLKGSCHRSAPTITVAAPPTNTIATSKVNTTDNTIEIANHGFRTGTKLTYGNGGGTVITGLSDSTAYFVIAKETTDSGTTFGDLTANTFALASSLSNAQAGTAIAISGAGNNSQTLTGDTATATATVSGGRVTKIAITGVGSAYTSAPSVTLAAPATETINGSSSSVVIVADDEIVVASAFYNNITTGDPVTYAHGGGTAIGGLTTATGYFLIKSDTSNRISLATTAANANGGTKITLSGVGSGSSHTLIGQTPTATATLGLGTPGGDVGGREVAHVGWVKKTIGTGGRAGRVFYETLVAASSISGDSEDLVTPDS